MKNSDCFKVNFPNITHETIDGEVVIVDLNTGNYYSMDKAGAVIWNLIDEGLSIHEIIAKLSAHYDGGGEGIEKSVYELLKELQEENLITPNGQREKERQNAQEYLGKQNSLASKTRFDTPILQKYSDMQDLLLLDPIHEVDQSGWPHPKEKSESD